MNFEKNSYASVIIPVDFLGLQVSWFGIVTLWYKAYCHKMESPKNMRKKIIHLKYNFYLYNVTFFISNIFLFCLYFLIIYFYYCDDVK